MKIQQIRNATLKIRYGGFVFLLDPWLQDKGTGPSFKATLPEFVGIKSPMNDLPMEPEEILKDAGYCLVTHIHPDHFTKDYLPKNIKIIVPGNSDRQIVKEYGFQNVISMENGSLKIGDVTLTKVPAIHGDNPALVSMMGNVSGYVLTGEEKTLYFAGDTIFYDGVLETLHKFSPDVIVVNCCAATNPVGRLIMNLDDVESVCTVSPKSILIATHLDSVNHALLTSDDVRRFAKSHNHNNVIVPQNGDVIVV